MPHFLCLFQLINSGDLLWKTTTQSIGMAWWGCFRGMRYQVLQYFSTLKCTQLYFQVDAAIGTIFYFKDRVAVADPHIPIFNVYSTYVVPKYNTFIVIFQFLDAIIVKQPSLTPYHQGHPPHLLILQLFQLVEKGASCKIFFDVYKAL